MINYNELRTVVVSCTEGSDVGLDFKMNMFKLTEKVKPFGLIPLFYKEKFNAKYVTSEDVPLLTEYYKKENILWFDQYKSYMTIIFVREEDMDENLQFLLQEVLRARLDDCKKPIFSHKKPNSKLVGLPKCHKPCPCMGPVDIVKVLTTITGTYPCYTALISKAVAEDCIHMNVRFRANLVLMEKENQISEEFDFKAVVDGQEIKYDNIFDAYNAIEDGGVITIGKNVELSTNLEIRKPCTIQAPKDKKYTIGIAKDFVHQKGTNEFIYLNTNGNGIVTFKNIIIDADYKTTGIYADNCTLVMNNCEVTHCESIEYSGGIYLTNNVHATLNNCVIHENKVLVDYDPIFMYCSDLYVGARAKCIVNNSWIGKAFVDANDQMDIHTNCEGKGEITMNSGYIEFLYLFFDLLVGANLIYYGGEIKDLILESNDNINVYHVEETLIPRKTYSAGDPAASGITMYRTVMK